MFLRILLTISIMLNVLQADWKEKRENLDNIYSYKNFRIFYTLKGEHQLENQQDKNNNNIPDIVEDIATQLIVAEKIFNKLAFKNPIENSVYRNRVKYIDIHILKRKETENGSTGDGIVQYKYKHFNNDGKSVSISLSNKLTSGNLTPIHELFHVYQNSVSLFKNRWYTEGTARWSEQLFKKNRSKDMKKLPFLKTDIDELLKKTYSTKYFWNRLAYICHKKEHIDLMEFKDINYVITREKILEDDIIYGSDFIKTFLNNLDKQDNIISKIKGFDELNWKENIQKSEENNKYILQALYDTIIEECPNNNNELQKFKSLLNEYLEVNNLISLLK